MGFGKQRKVQMENRWQIITSSMTSLAERTMSKSHMVRSWWTVVSNDFFMCTET